MAIKNCDGTPFRLVGSLNQFDPESREHDLFDQWDSEVIEFGGSPIYYYEVFIQQQTIDPVYRDDRGKIFSNNPILLHATYEPVPSQNYMNMFGMDSPNQDMQFQLNYRAVLKAIGHPPKIGSRIFTPHKRENWVIIQRNVGEFKMWGEVRLLLLCEKFQESVTTGEGRVTQKQPDFKLNEGSLLR